MSDPSNELPPVRIPQSDLWSGTPTAGPAPARPLTYAEKELLKAYVLFRERAPSQRWLLWRGTVNGLILLILFGFLCTVGGMMIAFVAFDTDAPSVGEPIEYGWLGLIALTTWLGLTFGAVVRDQIDLRQTVAGWDLVKRVLKYPTMDRMLESGTLATETGEGDAKEART